MQYLNDDMDDVFRSAAENYELKVKGADWNKVAAALETEYVPEVPKKSKSNIYNKILLFLLLFPIPFLCDRFIKFDDGVKLANKEINSQNSSFQINTIEEKIAVNNNTTINTSANSNPSTRINYNKTESNRKLGKSNLLVQSTLSKDIHKTDVIITGEKGNEKSTDNIAKQPEQKLSEQINTTVIKDEANNEISAIVEEKKIDSAIAKEEKSAELPLVKTKEEKRKKVYAGFIGGGAVTTVKFQKTTNVGYDIGFVLGYQINANWGLETGVLSTRKNYYTEGKHFYNYKMYLPPNTKITSVDGNCRMIEVPIVVKYNFNSKKENGWFATAGISNLIMKQENYDYVYLYMNSGTSVNHFKSYKNSSQDWMSIFQLSGGYSVNVKKIVDVRLEPYVQLPLKGVGYGNLPLSSAGLRLGITKKLF